MLRIISAMTALLFTAAAARGEEWLPLRVAVHVDTSISHSNRTVTFAGIRIRETEGEVPQTMEDILAIARRAQLDAVILADRARSTVSYGLTPFSRLFRLTVSDGSIAEYGATEYLKRVRDAEASSGVIVIPGAECIPYYRWRGNPFSGLRLSHLYEHMVIVGLDTREAIEAIPDTAGGYGYRLSWTVLLNLVPITLLVLGVRLWRRRRKPRTFAGGLLVVVAILVLVDCAPFLQREISAYDDPAASPADVLGEYAESRGALAFWAHPSANPGALPRKLKKTSGIDVEVRPYREVLHRTKHYTGFAMFNAGIAAGRPGQEWDTALQQYCAGERQRPVWVISECDFDAHSPPEALPEAQTVVWARARSAEAILDALRHGRCYATPTCFYKWIDNVHWQVSDGATTARSGEALVTSAPSVKARVQFTTALLESAIGRLKVKFIVDGRVKEVTPRPSADGAALAATADVEIKPAKKISYVRALLCDNDEPILALNPIFVTRGP